MCEKLIIKGVKPGHYWISERIAEFLSTTLMTSLAIGIVYSFYMLL